jgi:hypothetical protein
MVALIAEDIRLPRESADFVYVPVLNSTGVDPTAYPVQMAFTQDGSTDRPTFQDADWDVLDGIHYAVVLVGTGGLVLAPGRWRPWWKVIANPEHPVRSAPNVLIIT